MVDTMVGIPQFSYPARQNFAPRPKGEFAHIRMIEEYQVGIPNQQIKSQTDLETVYWTVSPARIRFRIGVVDTDGLAATRIMHGWTSEAMKTLMIMSGYGFIRCTPLSNEDAKLEKEWEYRQGFSVDLYTTRYFEETVNNINALDITGEYVTSTIDSYLFQFNINE
jgi:hypothetical protein